MSDQVILAIIGALVTVIGTVLGAVVRIQSNRLKSQELALKTQKEEQERQAATITRLANEAQERQKQRLAEREADRAEEKDRREEYKKAADYFQELWQTETTSTKAQRIEIAGLTQQVIDAIKTNDELNRQYARSDREHAADIERLKAKTEENDKLQKQLEARDALLEKSESIVSRQQTAIDRLIEKFDKDLINLSDANGKIVTGLQTRITNLESENADLQKQIGVLRSQLEAIGTVPEPPEPPKTLLVINAETGEAEKKEAA